MNTDQEFAVAKSWKFVHDLRNMFKVNKNWRLGNILYILAILEIK